MLSGSLWVMYHLNHNMMPGMMPDTTEVVPESMQAMPEMPGMPKTHDMQHMQHMQ
jgi:cytochrome o ubiquinol oxidase operon protein cyoD